MEVPMLRKAFLVGAALLFLASPVMAQKLAIVRACAANISTLCKDVHAGKGRLAACVDSHFSELSGICQAVVTTVATTAKSCIADVKKLCAGVKPRGTHRGLHEVTPRRDQRTLQECAVTGSGGQEVMAVLTSGA
jgi:hypothetical protein